jgi:hypothetical protein
MANPSSARIVRLVDSSDRRRLVEAYVYRDYPSIELEFIESTWATARAQATEQGLSRGLASLEHAHWDWRNKVHSVEAVHHRLVAIEYRNQVQGIMAVLQAPKRSRLSDEPLLYVDYLESAPWNLRSGANPPRYMGIGTALIAEAVHLSSDAGLEGRIGLHSLPQSEAFYKSRCRMKELGQDIQYFDLTYFEFTSEQAIQWLADIGDQYDPKPIR